MVALGSTLGRLLSGPVTKHNPSSLTIHVENNVLHIKTTNLEERKIDNFWKLDLTPSLFDVLLCFRFNPIGIIADIETAYLQISVTDRHRNF